MTKQEVKDEFKNIIAAFSLTDEEVKKLMLNSADAAFTTTENHEMLKSKIEIGFKEFVR